MARKRRRDHSSIANTHRLLPSRGVTSPVVTFRTPVDDRRLFHPEAADRPPLSFGSRIASVGLVEPRAPGRTWRSPATRTPSVNKPLRPSSQTKAKIGFVGPRSVVVCVKRKTRKEVLHAKKVAGRKGFKRKPRRTWLSNIRC